MIVSTADDWFTAIRSRRHDVVSRYMRKFAGTRTPCGDTGLMLAVRQMNSDVVKTLAPTEARLQNNDGLTALLIAAELNCLACCLPLLQYERDICDSKGRTPLMLAARAGSIGCLPFLVTGMALVRDNDHFNSLDHAVSAGKPEAVRFLLQPNLYSIEDVRRAIDLADSLEHLAISKILCRHIAGCSSVNDISPPSSVIISTVPDKEHVNGDTFLIVEASASTKDHSFTNTDASMCLADLNIPVPSASYIKHHSIDLSNESSADMLKWLTELTEINNSQQSDYRNMAALCNEARLKLAMQKDAIDTSIALISRVDQLDTNASSSADKGAISRVLQGQLEEIDNIHQEIETITASLRSLCVCVHH